MVADFVLELGLAPEVVWTTSIGFLETLASRRVERHAKRSGGSYSRPLNEREAEQKRKARDVAKLLVK